LAPIVPSGIHIELGKTPSSHSPCCSWVESLV